MSLAYTFIGIPKIVHAQINNQGHACKHQRYLADAHTYHQHHAATDLKNDRYGK